MDAKNTSKGAKPAQNSNEQKKHEATMAELKKQNEALIKRLEALEKENKPKNLLDQIKFIEEKQSLIKKLKTLNLFKDELLKVSELVQPQAETNDFEKKEYTLKLSYYREYGEGQEVFKITNPLVILKTAEFIISAISEKCEELKKQIGN